MTKKETIEPCCKEDTCSSPKELKLNTCCQDDQCNEAKAIPPDEDDKINQAETLETIKGRCCEDDTCNESKVVRQDQPPSPSADSCCQEGSCGKEIKKNVDKQQDKKPFEGVSEKISEFRIHGMDCPACAMTIEKRISNLKNIKEVNVNYSTSKMRVIADDATALEQLTAEVQKLGYTLEPLDKQGHTRTYYIEGMDCGACAVTIENHLKTLPNVKNVSVNFSTGKMIIEHEGSSEEIIKEVAKIGYKASLVKATRKNQPETPHVKSTNSSTLLSGVLLALGFLGSYTNVPSSIITILYALSIVIGGYRPARSAYYAIKSGSLDMNVLMTAAAVGAAFIGEWFEGATVVWLFALGNALQNKSIERTRNSIRNLMNLAPPEAWVKKGQELIRKPVEEISIGEIIVIKPGEKIPLDGEIIQGTSSVNQAPITGESVPVDKEIGDPVYAGTINESGSIEVKVTKLVEDTTLSKIIHLVEEAQEKKAPTQAFVDKFARIYTPIVFGLALMVMVIPPLLGFGTWAEWFYKGLELLVVACPCALVISTPVAIVSAIGNAARNGVLIKGGTFLETAGAINVIAFDKTGTLTEGKPRVSQVFTFECTEEELLSIARTIEEHSKHPIAAAIIDYTTKKGIQPRKGESFKAIVGKGAQATIDGTEYYAGNLKLFQELKVPLQGIKDRAIALQNEGNTLVIIGTKEKIFGIIAVADIIRESTVTALKNLKEVGIRQVVMLTGDNEGTARKISSQAGVDQFFAELLPEDKVRVVKELQKEGSLVAMVGDGINDAPALATANLGIAMGGAGTDTAMETADIVLMADNLEKLPHTIQLGRQALRIIKQNIWFSLITKFIALILIFPGWLTLWLAVLSDTGAALLVILNSMRLLKSR